MKQCHLVFLIVASFYHTVSSQDMLKMNKSWYTNSHIHPNVSLSATIDLVKKPAKSNLKILPMSGWPVKAGLWPQYPVTADLNDDGNKEIIIADRSGRLHIFKLNGEYYSDSWPMKLGSDLSAPAVADINKDGQLNIVIVESYCFLSPYWPNSRVHLLNPDGTYLPGWPVILEGGHNHLNSVSVGDINNDGILNIITATGNSYSPGDGSHVYYKKMYAFNSNGTFVDGWPIELYVDSGINLRPRSPKVLVDLNNDGCLEIISGFIDWDDANSSQNAIFALRYDGTTIPGYFPIITKEWNYSLASADMNGDGQYEVFSHGRKYKNNGFNDIDWKIQKWVISPLSFADVNQDGLPELIYGTGGTAEVFVVDIKGDPLPGWPVKTKEDGNDIVDSNPIAGDIDGDGDIEIIIGSYKTNLIFAWHHDGTVVDGFPIESGRLDNYRIAISDLDGDGDIEIISANSDSMIYVWDIPSTGPCTNLEWPMYQHDERHTGVYPSSFTGVADQKQELIPTDFSLLQNYPNPFNGETHIPYTLSYRSDVSLAIYDLQGRKVRQIEQGFKNAGYFEAVWQGNDGKGKPVSSGIYLAVLRVGRQVERSKVVLVK